MDITDLMTNDYVFNEYNRKPEKVQEVYKETKKVMLDYNDLYDMDDISPIALNDEILEKIGFMRSEGLYKFRDSGFVMKKFEEGCYTTEKLSEGKDTLRESRMIRYVHELQDTMRLYGLHDEADNIEL